MKITDVQALYPNYRQKPAGWRGQLWQIVVRVETDVGVTGYGFGGGGQASLPIVNGHFRETLVGRSLNSVAEIAQIWDDLYAASIPYGRKGVAIMALSGVDLALWDALGKAEKKPVYELLGGLQKARIRAYATGADPVWYHELGFNAYKFPHRWSGDPAGYDDAVQKAAKARAVFGPDAPIMADCYMSWDATVAREMAARLADYRLTWFEDVLTPDLLDEQGDLRPAIKPVQLAGGEHEFTHHGFAEIARAGALDIWQPDITWCGGVTAGVRIVEMAAQAGVRVVPHRGGEVWGLHLIAASSCDDLAEILPGTRDAPVDDLWLGQPMPTNGVVTLSDAPGFGVTLNESAL